MGFELIKSNKIVTEQLNLTLVRNDKVIVLIAKHKVICKASNAAECKEYIANNTMELWPWLGSYGPD